MEEKQLLYLFKLNEETGEIEQVFATLHYEETVVSKYIDTRIYGIDLPYTYGTIRVRKENIDKCVNYRVYTFNPDPVHARQIIYNTIYEKKEKTRKELNRWEKVLSKMNNI